MSYSLELIEKIFCKEKYMEISRIFSGKKYAVIKGEVLSLYAYNAPHLRKSSDVDILVPRMSLKDIEKELQNNSFENECLSRRDEVMLLTSSHQTLPWGKYLYPWGNLIIDLNFDVFWGEYEGKRIDISGFLSDTVDIDICGVKIKSLTPLKAMVQLILHDYKDMNSIYLLSIGKSIKTSMFKDIFYLLKNNSETISIEKLYSICDEYGIIPYAYYILFYTGQVFKDDILSQYIDAFKTQEGEMLLNCYGLSSKERKEWRYDFYTRLKTDDLSSLIKDDLNEKDKEKITVNKRVFMGVTE